MNLSRYLRNNHFWRPLMMSYKGLWDFTYNFSVNYVENYGKLHLTFYFQPITAKFQVVQTCSLHQSIENWFLNIFSVS